MSRVFKYVKLIIHPPPPAPREEDPDPERTQFAANPTGSGSAALDILFDRILCRRMDIVRLEPEYWLPIQNVNLFRFDCIVIVGSIFEVRAIWKKTEEKAKVVPAVWETYLNATI